MIGKTIMVAAFALATAGTAQMQPPATPPDQMDPMTNSTMSNSMMSNSMDATTPKMSRSDTAAMKRCKAMLADAMAKNSRCTRLMQKYPQNGMTPM